MTQINVKIPSESLHYRLRQMEVGNVFIFRDTLFARIDMTQFVNLGTMRVQKFTADAMESVVTLVNELYIDAKY